VKLEIGGGEWPRGRDWANLDMLPCADIVHNLEIRPWPIGDDTVEEVYSCHCFEHVGSLDSNFREIARICKLGAPVEIRMPHPYSHLAMIEDHKHVFGPVAAINMEEHFPSRFWLGVKRLKLERMELHPSIMLPQARADLPFLAGLSDEVVMRWIPGTCHETRFFYRCITNEFYKG
jgi:hypothetical protein